MRKLLATAALVLSSIAGPGCGGSSTSNPITCGAGTHDNGSGTCVLDAAVAIENTASTYWSCPGNSVGYLQFLSGGTGQRHFSNPPGVEAITWNETAGTTAGITFSVGTSFHTLSAITPNAPSGPVSFTANYDTSYPTSCTLHSGAMP